MISYLQVELRRCLWDLMTRDFHRLCRDHQWTLLKFQRGFSLGLILHKCFSVFWCEVLGIPLLDIIRIHWLPTVIFNISFWEVNASILGIFLQEYCMGSAWWMACFTIYFFFVRDNSTCFVVRTTQVVSMPWHSLMGWLTLCNDGKQILLFYILIFVDHFRWSEWSVIWQS